MAFETAVPPCCQRSGLARLRVSPATDFVSDRRSSLANRGRLVGYLYYTMYMPS